jgi:hypothetical protein
VTGLRRGASGPVGGSDRRIVRDRQAVERIVGVAGDDLRLGRRLVDVRVNVELVEEMRPGAAVVEIPLDDGEAVSVERVDVVGPGRGQDRTCRG